MIKMNRKGSTLINVMIATAISAIMGLILASIFTDSFKQQKITERKYNSMALGQEVRSLYTNQSLCKCNFASAVVFPESSGVLSATTISTLRYYADSSCAGPTSFLTTGSSVPGDSTTSVSAMTLKNPMLLTGNVVNADLEISYSVPGGNVSPPKPLLIPNLMFNVAIAGGNATVTNCAGAGSESDAASAPSSTPPPPTICGPGKFCWDGKSVTFTNEVGNAVAVTFVSKSGSEYNLMFSTAAGRNVLLKLTDNGTNFVPSAMLGWRPQLCYSHPAAPCNFANYFGRLQFNCGSGILWRGSYTGSTVSLKVNCP